MANLYISTNGYQLMIDKRELRKALRKVGTEIKKTAQGLIALPKTGIKYGYGTAWDSGMAVRARGGSRHQASAPGEPPATQTGLLGNSMKVTMRRDTVRITDSAFYSLILEAGAKGGGRAKGGKSGKSVRRGNSRLATTQRIMAPRPYLSSALEKTDVQGQLDRACEKLITDRTTFK